MKADLFKEWLPSITVQKNDMFKESFDPEGLERMYPAFMINRALSQYEDTVLLANEMNVNSSLEGKLQYDFLLNTIKKKKRFSKWAKKESLDINTVVMSIYTVSSKRAQDIIDLLNEEELSQLSAYNNKGGKK